MVKGFILEYDKREGLICKKVKEWEGSLRNNEKGRGFWAKSPFFSLLPSRGIGEARMGTGGGPRRRPRARQWPGPWGKERGRLVGSTPPPRFQGRRPAGRGAMAAGGGRLWPARWWRCRAWRQPELEGKGRGSQGGSIPYLGSGWGAARRGAPRWPVS